MKKLFLPLLLLGTTFSLLSQKETYVGIHIGGGFGDFRGSSSVERLQSDITIYFGAILERDLGTNTFLRIGLEYGKKQMDGFAIGVSFDNFNPGDQDFIDQISDLKTNITALTIPIAFGYKTGGTIKFIATAGGYGSYIINSDGLFTKNFDFGVTASIGAEYALTDTRALRFEISDQLGLTNISGSQFSPTAKSNRIGVQLSYVHQL